MPLPKRAQWQPFFLINNNLTILNNGGAGKYALYSANASRINVNHSIVQMTGRTQAIGNSIINLNSLTGSAINGDAVLGGAGQIHFNLTGTEWFLSGNSQLSSLTGNASNIRLAGTTATSFMTLSIGDLGGNGQGNINFNILCDFLKGEFCKPVGKGTEFLYKISNSICIDLLDIPNCGGFIYPAIDYFMKGFNVALKPEAVDEALEFNCMFICQRGELTKNGYDMYLKYKANGVDEKGNLIYVALNKAES